MTPDARVQPVVLLRILVADSGRSVNERLTALLSELDGLSVFGCAQEPSRVLALIQTVHPDVVILDLQIAGPVGMKTLAQVKGLPDAPIVIVLSDRDEAPLRQAAIKAGAEHFLVKTDIERLQEVLKSLLRQSAARGGPLAEPRTLVQAVHRAHDRGHQTRR